MENNQKGIPLSAVLQVNAGDQKIAEIPFNGNAIYRSIPSAATGHQLQILFFNFDPASSSAQVNNSVRLPSTVRLTIGMECVLNELIMTDEVMIEALLGLARSDIEAITKASRNLSDS
jgi:hypothetical protein